VVFSQKPKAARCAHTGGNSWNGQHFPAPTSGDQNNKNRRTASNWNGFQKGESLDLWNGFQFTFANG
jgi:hypothetical protein